MARQKGWLTPRIPLSKPRLGLLQQPLAHQLFCNPTPMLSGRTSAGKGSVLPVYDLQDYLAGNEAAKSNLAEGIATSLHTMGACVVRDPRVQSSDQAAILDTMETYQQQPTEDKLRDARPNLQYQVGTVPAGTVVNAAHKLATQAMSRRQTAGPRAGPLRACGTCDLRWRFSARINPSPVVVQYMKPVTPQGFFNWEDVLQGWGNKMVATISTVAELAAQGFGLPHTAFTERLACGPHLLAPSGTDLSLEQHNQAGRVIADRHADLSFLTIHGKSRYPGLHIWLRDGTCIPALIPDGCLLVQAGVELEWLTGGHVQAGIHEVVSTYATAVAVEEARQAGRPLWHVSSTVFGHVASDQVLKPLGRFDTLEARDRYFEVQAGDLAAALLNVPA